MSEQDAPLEFGDPDGLRVAVHPYGARIASVRVPGRDGLIETVLNHATPRPPPGDRNFLGNTVGRVSGRIARSRFTLDGATHQLEPNEGANHLHGGPGGFHVRRWTVLNHDARGPRPEVKLALHSPAGDGGYPGALDVTATFRIDGDVLAVELVGRCDAASPLALTLHPYFNLSGDHGQDIADHWLTLAAARYLELDEEFLPTGRVPAVDGTPFDFRVARPIGAFDATVPELRATAGYDHTWVCSPAAPWQARLEHRQSALTLEVRSNQPGLQFYAGQYLQPTDGTAWRERCGLCLEPQCWPNAVNEPAFPSPILRPGETYRNDIQYRFMPNAG